MKPLADLIISFADFIAQIVLRLEFHCKENEKIIQLNKAPKILVERESFMHLCLLLESIILNFF